jgi:cytoskeletal protein CcmA (bactofilin family)
MVKVGYESRKFQYSHFAGGFMSDFRSRLFDETEIDTIIGEDIHFDGEMAFEQSVAINGRVKGTIRFKDDLFINENAVIDARMEGEKAWVKGQVQGDVAARQRLELFATAVFDGNIRTADLIVQSGCKFNGRCEMPRQEARDPSHETDK